jgi:hypothetical protein
MPKEPKDPKPPLVIEPFADGESSVLGAFARIEEGILNAKKDNTSWTVRIDQLRGRLSTPVAKQVAAYLLGEETHREDDPVAKQAAWRYARAMMLQIRPGFRDWVAAENQAETSKGR